MPEFCRRFASAVNKSLALLAILFLIDSLTTAQCAPRQLPDGRILFEVEEKTDRTIGNEIFSSTKTNWTRAEQSATWKYKPSRWGRYEAWITGIAQGGWGSEMRLAVGREELSFRLIAETNSSQESVRLGCVYIPSHDSIEVSVQLLKLNGAAKVIFGGLELRPTYEGVAPFTGADGVINLPSSAALTHSTVMRYEPATNKNCLGYWINAKDWAEWRVFSPQTGTYDIEVMQGCGKGSGGSEVEATIEEQSLKLTVEDTGHFQNFVPKGLGKVFLTPGYHALTVKALNKAGGAVMDIRSIRLIPAKTDAAQLKPLRHFGSGKRVVFLGDSITYSGEYIEFIETYLRIQYPLLALEFINMGLPSETVSGLSEPGHAGGSFPRPTLHERLRRVLDKTQPDLVVACYGMNDGIYYPFSEDRFTAFKNGIELLHHSAVSNRVQIVHITPPVFDPLPLKGRTLPAGREVYPAPYEGYNDVLDRYSAWLLSKQSEGWEVIDIHGPMNTVLAERRKSNPNFILAGDGVHLNTQGHWLMAREFLKYFSAPETLLNADDVSALTQLHPNGAIILQKTQQRERQTKDAWLTAAGHLRPGMGRGKPLPEAIEDGHRLDRELHILAR